MAVGQSGRPIDGPNVPLIMNTALLLARFEVAAAGTGQLMEFVIVAMLSVHLLLVDLAMAGPLAALWLEWRRTSSGSAILR